MKKLRILKNVLHATKADRLLGGFFAFLFVIAAILWAVEPGIKTYQDGLWYCFAVIFTTGFGDLVAETILGQVCSVLLSCYSIFIIAIVTGVVVSFYQQVIQVRYDDAKLLFLDKLERLPELSREELEAIADRVKKMR